MFFLRQFLNTRHELFSQGCKRRFLNWTTRSHKCGELTVEDVGKKVKLAGWIQHIRLQKFLVLRDTYGTIQLILGDSSMWDRLKEVSLESVIEVSGVVVHRPDGQSNPKMKSGQIEIKVDSIDALNPSKKSLPFYIKEFNEGKEPLRMQYRYLDLRRSVLQSNLRLRSDVVMKMRNFLTDHGFVDVETPTLFRRTPGGAREFVVPTHTVDKYYTLVQSPQQFKQLLMVGGLDRYFQIARCYRDEGARPDRQPEFTQVDIELSFTHREGIEDIIEQLLKASWPEKFPPIKTPFLKMKYEDCMKFYGCDKPDLRIESRIKDVTSLITKDKSSKMVQKILHDGVADDVRVKCVKFGAKSLIETPSSTYMTKEIPEILNKVNQHEEQKLVVSSFQMDSEGLVKSSFLKKLSPEIFESFVREIDLQKGDVGVLVIGQSELTLKSLSKVRTEFGANFLDLDRTDFRFLWVEDFPLFLPAEEASPTGIESAHHPFTQPHPDDINLIYTDPLKVRGLHYDLVLNGFEIGGGSIRIHDPKLQEYVLNDVLGEDTTNLSHLLEALACGCPPHGGIALGLDRLIAILCQANSIRDVIAFPKSGEGKDLMADAPAAIREEDKVYYHLKKNNSEKCAS